MMIETTELMTTAATVLDNAYDAFQREQLARDSQALFDHADQIFTIQMINQATHDYLFDEAIAKRVVALGSRVLMEMYQRATSAEVVKFNFTGNDIRWLLDLPRAHRRQR